MIQVFKKQEKTEWNIKKAQEITSLSSIKIVPHFGHKIFELDLMEGTIDEAKYELIPFRVTSVSHLEKNKQNKRILMRENCIYISALNEKNAVKKCLKGINGSKF